jgi:phosphopantothenoylcysteine decarboxylase/phosphopantothenate--cysteine ligase
VIGFAAETENVLGNARQKLQTKKLDAIVANDVTRGDSGFDSVSNAITIIKRNSDQPLELPLMAKTDAAHHILDEIVSLRQG